ncbi:dynein axonemal assembly factor 9-like [Babylonia areolata]|uniref:dynein axonemal assembly factor 9-like n=1 Tax=Babylonia areolata TaxID=304850 RepID=UPI003FD07542
MLHENMSAGYMKRPSSAKRHIKYKNFSQFVSACRLRRVQSLLDGGDSDGGKKSTGVDAILCVSGIDGRYNEGCYQLINYLLFGFFDVRKAELERSGFPEEVVDDLMLVIRKTRVDVYCNPVNWHYFLPYVSHWTNVSFHCLQEEEYDLDSDEGAELAEEFKVHSLIAMTAGCKRIGIPYYSTSTGPAEQKFDKMLVEKWPVVQAFALEDFGSGGFFTLKYEVSDVSSMVHQLQSLQDPVSIEILTTENLPILERQWKTMMDCVTMEIGKNKGVLTQGRISEPLCSFYQHGLVGNHRHNSGKCKVPFVVFGKNSSKAVLSSVQSGTAPPASDQQLTPADTVGHMVCQVMSPRSPLTCTRTYFVSPLLNALNDVAENGAEQQKKHVPADGGDGNVSASKEELRYLVTLYQAMVDAVITGIQVYAQSASLSQARVKVVEELNEGCQSIISSALSAYLSDKARVVFSVESVYKHGSVEEVVDGQRNALMKVATLWLYDIPAARSSAPSPGSLVFSECFQDSAITVSSGVKTSVDSDILFLTSHIPRCMIWGASANSRDDQAEVRRQLETEAPSRLGKLLMAGDKVEITAGSELTLPPEAVQLYVYQNGLAMYSESYGSFALSASDCSHVHLFDGDSMTTSKLLILTYHTWSAVKLPPHLLSSDNMLFIVMAPRSKAQNHLYGQVLTSWKEDSDMPPVSRIESEDLPEQLDALYHYLQQVNQYEGLHNLLTAPNATSLKEASHNLPHLPEFLKHLSVSCAISNAVSGSDLPHLLQREPDFEVTSDNEQVMVTVLTGVPGSEKQSLCKTLSKLGTNYIRWVVVRQMEEGMLDVGQIQRMLSAAVTSHLQQDSNKRQTRVLLVAPGFVNTPDVVSTVLKHPDTKVRNMLKIGAVTACIDPLNTFIQNRMLLPMLLNHCSQGWVNNIIFTSQTKAPSTLLDQIQSLIRSVNSDVALLLAESGEIKRSTDLDQVVSESAFDQPAMVRARLLLYPGWKLQTKIVPLRGSLDMNDVILKFSRPLERAKLMQHMKALPGSLSKFPFEGNIYHIYGLVCFADSNTTVDLQFTVLSGSLVLHTVGTHSQPFIRGQHHYYMVFTGCRLQEHALRDWLRTCAKQKPEKKKHMTKADIPRAEMNKIHKDHHLEPLPSGWFYNGTQFVSMAGQKSDTHPFMKDFIVDYLKKKNEEIDKYNAAIDKEKFPDLFA